MQHLILRSLYSLHNSLHLNTFRTTFVETDYLHYGEILDWLLWNTRLNFQKKTIFQDLKKNNHNNIQHKCIGRGIIAQGVAFGAVRITSS